MSIWSLLLLTALVVCCHGYKILVVFPMPAKSHSNLGNGVVSALAKAGHEITYLTPFPTGKGSPNVREIDLSPDIKPLPESIGDLKQFLKKDFQSITSFMVTLYQLYGKTVENKDVQKLIDDPNEQFDVIIIEWFYLEFIAGLSAVFNCPYIWLSPNDPSHEVLSLVGETSNPAYTPDALSTNTPPFTFFQRVRELVTMFGGLYRQYFSSKPIQYKEYERLMIPAIKKRGNIVPSMDDVIYNASLILSNSHVSMGKSIPLPQNLKPIGGYHISRDIKPLPEKLQKIFDSAKNGVIYFSMGSNLKSKFLPNELKQDLLKMFGGLKYTVLWKFEEELPGTPSNVHIMKWAPQPSILAHPNCVLFITHGGQLSTTETVHFGKPIVAIPVFADQFLNADRAVQQGFAKKVDLSYTMADDIKIAIEEILSNSKYSSRAKELATIYHDRPMTPDKELVHWVEHVVKTRGAPHLRSPALAVPWYQKLYLDLAALVTIILILIVVVIKKTLSYFRSHKSKTKKQKKQ